MGKLYKVNKKLSKIPYSVLAQGFDFILYGFMAKSHKGAFINYVGKILPIFDTLPPLL